jgi:hypothetical protein
MITIAHILSILVLNISMSKSAATVTLFVIGVIGGQGACIVFLTSLGAVLKMHSIISTSLVSINKVLYLLYLKISNNLSLNSNLKTLNK